jgi:hypothetical protein
MATMIEPRTGWLRGQCLFSMALSLVACGGGTKQASSPGTCPDGTVLHGSDCVPPEAEKSAPEPAESAPTEPSAPAEATDPTKPTSGSTSSGPTPYDKDAVESELRRGARQVKANCGAATDDDGQATGPWGKTKATITLGRNGHVKQVTVPAPYAGKPVGVCIVHAFDKIWFPPYAAAADVDADWDVEIVKPKGH